MLPEMGPAVAQLPTTSQTRRVSVDAFTLSTSPTTSVLNVNDASFDFASPLSLSAAVHVSVMLSPCHAPSGESHRIDGGVVSALTCVPPSTSASMQYSTAAGRSENKSYPVSPSTASI